MDSRHKQKMSVVEAFANRQIALIEQERECEMEEVNLLQSSLSPAELQRRGVALLSLRITGMRSGLGGKTLVDLETSTGGMDKLPTHKFRVGDIVGIEEYSASTRGSASTSKRNASTTGSVKNAVQLSGLVYRVTDTVLTVALQDDPSEKLPDKLRLSKLANNVTYQRMVDAMKLLVKIHSPGLNASLAQVLFNQTRPTFHDFALDSIQWLDKGLNESQKEAVRFALSANEVALIHGPPGTGNCKSPSNCFGFACLMNKSFFLYIFNSTSMQKGKTYTCVELVRQLVMRGDRVLVCGPSNIAVDNLVERLSKCKLDIVRIGNPARVHDQVIPYTLDVRVRSSDEGQIANDVRSEVDKTLKSASKAKSKSERRQLYQDVKSLRQELRSRERTVVESMVRNTHVVLSTLNGVASKVLLDASFDTVLIDEAAQALEVECWIAILKSKRLILAGDHLQLPPTVKSTNSKSKDQSSNKVKTPETASIEANSLEFTLFDRLIKMYGSSVKRLLNTQYRMNELIMKFSSKELYENRLVAGERVKSRLLTDNTSIKPTDHTSTPLLLIDTSGQLLDESSDAEDKNIGYGDLSADSKFNQGEAQLVVEHIESLIDAGVSDSDIAVITPYNAQVSLLRSMLKEKYPRLEIGSVDGFQGREKEAVVISLVRSNDKAEIGFVADSRRMNVALTRAKRHLCVIGNVDCLGNRSPFLKRMFQYFEEHGQVQYP